MAAILATGVHYTDQQMILGPVMTTAAFQAALKRDPTAGDQRSVFPTAAAVAGAASPVLVAPPAPLTVSSPLPPPPPSLTLPVAPESPTGSTALGRPTPSSPVRNLLSDFDDVGDTPSLPPPTDQDKRKEYYKFAKHCIIGTVVVASIAIAIFGSFQGLFFLGFLFTGALCYRYLSHIKTSQVAPGQP